MKHAHRKHIRNIISTMDVETMKRHSCRACQLLISTDEYRRSKVVMLFLSMAGEIDTTIALEAAFADKKTVAVPVVNFERKVMSAVELQSINENIAIDRYGIRYPLNAAEINVADIDFVIVPGLGFDTHGNRLGRGGGYYDKFLGAPGCRAIKCGFAFEKQVAPLIPTHSHDIKVDMLVTDSCVRRFGNS